MRRERLFPVSEAKPAFSSQSLYSFDSLLIRTNQIRDILLGNDMSKNVLIVRTRKQRPSLSATDNPSLCACEISPSHHPGIWCPSHQTTRTQTADPHRIRNGCWWVKGWSQITSAIYRDYYIVDSLFYRRLPITMEATLCGSMHTFTTGYGLVHALAISFFCGYILTFDTL